MQLKLPISPWNRTYLEKIQSLFRRGTISVSTDRKYLVYSLEARQYLLAQVRALIERDPRIMTNNPSLCNKLHKISHCIQKHVSPEEYKARLANEKKGV
jgi:hypothetical protein